MTQYLRVVLSNNHRTFHFPGQFSDAAKVLSYLRHEYDDVHSELEEMKVTTTRDQSEKKNLREAITGHAGVRRALFVGCSLQLFQQLSG